MRTRKLEIKVQTYVSDLSPLKTNQRACKSNPHTSLVDAVNLQKK